MRGLSLRKFRGFRIRCNETITPIVLVVRTHEREPMLKKKTILLIAAVVAIGYAVVTTNAFADTSVAPTVTASAAPTTPVLPLGVPAPSGIPAPSGLQNSPLSTMPSIGDDDGDDQGENQSDDTGINGDDDGDDLSLVGVSASLSHDDSGDQNQSDDNQGESGSND